MLYIIKSTLILGILLAVYHLFLEREKMHRFNRFYLLSGLVLAFATPLITVGTVDPVAATSFIAVAPTVITEVQSDIIYETEKGLDWLQFIFYIYGVITLIMLSRFINNVCILLIKSINNPVINHGGHKVVLIKDLGLPHTFLNYIFINQSDYESGNIEEELFIHEFAHADQRHSLDIILIELIHVFTWFNPLIILYKKAIQLNHEFLADEAVVESIEEVPAYQHLLLDKASNTEQVYLASNLNFAVTKKRLMMMTKPISKSRNLIYGMMFIPMVIGMVSSFGNYNVFQSDLYSNIDYISKNKFSVNFTGLTQDQLEITQKKVEEEGVFLHYNKVDIGSDGTVHNIQFTFEFNDKSRSAGIDYFASSSQPNEPYGFWINKDTDECGVGYLSPNLNLTKNLLYDETTSDKFKNANFYIKDQKVTYSEAVAWLRVADQGNSHTISKKYEDDRYTINLSSSDF